MKGNFLSLLVELQKQYYSYGAVKLVSSEDWSPPFTFRYIDHGITTRNQILQDLKFGKVTLLNSLNQLSEYFYFLNLFSPFNKIQRPILCNLSKQWLKSLKTNINILLNQMGHHSSKMNFNSGHWFVIPSVYVFLIQTPNLKQRLNMLLIFLLQSIVLPFLLLNRAVQSIPILIIIKVCLLLKQINSKFIY